VDSAYLVELTSGMRLPTALDLELAFADDTLDGLLLG
jgi:hypothetical protein